MACFFSVTKGLTALSAQILSDRGLLDVDAPIAHYWPEFAANGKEGVLVRHALGHNAGLLAVPRWWEIGGPDGTGVADSQAVTEAMAAAPLSWEPGTALGYHALTYGWMVGEVVRRIDGRSIGTFFADEVAAPLGLNMWIGLPEDQFGRASDSIPPDEDDPTEEVRAVWAKGWAAAEVDDMTVLEAAGLGSMFFPKGCEKASEFITNLMNAPVIRRSEVPGGNGVGTARSLARMYALLAAGGTLDGVCLVSPESVAKWSSPNPLADGTPTGYGFGYALYEPDPNLGMGAGRFGHSGAGGSVGWADPQRRVGYGWVKNKMRGDHGVGVMKAVYACLDRVS